MCEFYKTVYKSASKVPQICIEVDRTKQQLSELHSSSSSAVGQIFNVSLLLDIGFFYALPQTSALYLCLTAGLKPI